MLGLAIKHKNGEVKAYGLPSEPHGRGRSDSLEEAAAFSHWQVRMFQGWNWQSLLRFLKRLLEN